MYLIVVVVVVVVVVVRVLVVLIEILVVTDKDESIVVVVVVVVVPVLAHHSIHTTSSMLWVIEGPHTSLTLRHSMASEAALNRLCRIVDSQDTGKDRQQQLVFKISTVNS